MDHSRIRRDSRGNILMKSTHNGCMKEVSRGKDNGKSPRPGLHLRQIELVLPESPGHAWRRICY